MAVNSLTPQDAYTLINSIAKQATGRSDLVATDTSSFVSVGETLLRTGVENTLKTMSTVFAETYFANESYTGKLRTVEQTNVRWGAIVREITSLSMEAEQSDDWNTEQNPNTFDDGKSIDMYKIHKPKVLELKFYGTKLLQRSITRFRDQLALAFSSEDEFLRFYEAVMIEFRNDIETDRESERRATMLNYMAGLSSLGMEVDLAHEFNTENETQYTRKQLLSEHRDKFMPFVVARIKLDSEKMTERSNKYRFTIKGFEDLLRFTRKENQRLMMLSSFWIGSETQTLPYVFDDKNLQIENKELVNWWQSADNESAIQITPSIIGADGHTKQAETEVNLPYVLGVLYDRRAMGVNWQFDYSSTTPFNSRGGYYNMFVHSRKNYWNNFTHNGILYVIGEGATTSNSAKK